MRHDYIDKQTKAQVIEHTFLVIKTSHFNGFSGKLTFPYTNLPELQLDLDFLI